jgi:acetyl-CoA/propionyl-CoA carboxylase biotin carboxyl carrier protein
MNSAMKRAVNRVLIANRGEIAVRIIRACADTGRTSIAVYADDDVDALFVQLADEAYPLEGRTPQDSYLHIGNIIQLAVRANADAIHPGYGFLSENADFAQAAIDAGLVWIGPPPEVIRLLGDKVQARRIAAEVGAPMAPGTTSPVADAEEVVDFAKTHGLPLAIKAVYGGGGRGLKVVRRLEDINEAFASATHEAELAFGNGSSFVERFLDKPRHVEVQILADAQGHTIAVGTRDCSLQRRNQKLVEEAPAPFLSQEISDHLKQSAIAICRQAGYVSAGTVEFLLSADGLASFMEVNTRLQVEHPVTEATSGIDLVIEQFRIAEGESIEGLEVLEHGHAMEFRINAEDPAHGFIPFPGTITELDVPGGPGVRFDAGVRRHSTVSSQFDSMLAKLIVYAPNREQCIRRARKALSELRIGGVPTVIGFDRKILESADFVSNDHLGVYTRWIEESFLSDADPQEFADRAASPNILRSWIEIDGRQLRIGLPDSLLLQQPGTVHARKATVEPDPGSIRSTITGTLVRWLVEDGDILRAGDPVAVVEAMKMETQITALESGVLQQSRHPGDSISFDDEIGRIVS